VREDLVCSQVFLAKKGKRRAKEGRVWNPRQLIQTISRGKFYEKLLVHNILGDGNDEIVIQFNEWMNIGVVNGDVMGR